MSFLDIRQKGGEEETKGQTGASTEEKDTKKAKPKVISFIGYPGR